MSTLKNCPWCNPKHIPGFSAVVRVTKGEKHGVACIEPYCKVSPVILADTQEEADTIWNTRAQADGQGVDEVIKSSKPGSPLIRRSVDVDGNKVVILAEWFYEELAALKGTDDTTT